MATCWVNVFTHGPLKRAAVNSAGGQFGTDSIMSVDPPLGRAYFPTLDTVTAQASDPSIAPQGTELLAYEVQSGFVVGYERSNGNQPLRTADAQSPTIEGKGFLSFGPGWKLSLIQRTP